MSIKWHLKSFLSQKHSIHSATLLQKKIAKKTGYIISLPMVCRLLNNKPTIIKLETMELICSTLNCQLTDFMSVGPKKFNKIDDPKKYSYKNTPLAKRGVKKFPNPKDYL